MASTGTQCDAGLGSSTRHSHGDPGDKGKKSLLGTKNSRNLAIFAALLFIFFVVEVVFAIITHSVSLLSDAFHMLSDLMAVVLAIYGIQQSHKPANTNFTYGLARSEVICGLVNGVFLLSVSLMMSIEVLMKLTNTDELKDLEGHGLQITIVGGLGLVVNIVGLVLLQGDHGHSHGGGGHGHSHAGKKKAKQSDAPGVHVTLDVDAAGDGHGHGHAHASPPAESHGHGHSHADDHDAHGHGCDHGDHGDHGDGDDKKASGDLNMRAAWLHAMGDALGSVVVVVVGLTVEYAEGDWRFYTDPALTIVILGIITYSAIPLVRDCVRVLLQGSPMDIDTDLLTAELEETHPAVKEVHDLHLWELQPGRTVGSMHVVFNNDFDTSGFTSVASSMKSLFHQHGIHSVAIQPEFDTRADGGGDDCQKMCRLSCEPTCESDNICCNDRLTYRSKSQRQSTSGKAGDHELTQFLL